MRVSKEVMPFQAFNIILVNDQYFLDYAVGQDVEL
jgi:hypothetical protein